MKRETLKINGKPHTVEVDPDTPLLYILRDDLGMNNPRFGCGLGQCGACTVLVNGVATRSCILPVSRATGKEITTLEGIGTPEKPHVVQTAFIREQAAQCGYCLNGWLLTAKALLDKKPNPSDTEIREATQSLICRCGSHNMMFAAIRRASQMASEPKRSA